MAASSASALFQVSEVRSAPVGSRERPPRGEAGRTAIFNVKYSPNLGDGIIAECLEDALGRAHGGIRPRSIDLAGRTVFDPGTGLRRRLLLKGLELLPDRLRAFLVPALLSWIVRYRLQPAWRRALDGCDSAVIGGGALLADTDQNFPIKISGALELCAERRLPVAIAHVGVTRGWSAAGRARLLAALRRTRLIRTTVRDPRSARNLAEEFEGALPAPQVALDPGLLCCETYGPGADASDARRRIGLCLTDPLVLRLHGDRPVRTRLLRHWWRAVVEGLRAPDRELLLFTSGSPEDEDFADELMREFAGRPAIAKVPRFVAPGDFARFIASLDCLVAHRLHACIAAYSYRIPAIGIAWDPKLRNFFELVGRERYVVDWQAHDAAQVAAMVGVALDDRPDAGEHAAILARCREGIADLAESLAAARRAP